MFFSTILTSILLGNLSIMPVEAPKYDLEERIKTEILPKLAYCESSLNEKAVNRKERHGYSWGKYQYRLETWQEKLSYYGLPKDWDILDGKDQDELTWRLIADKQGEKLWKNCWRKEKLNNYL